MSNKPGDCTLQAKPDSKNLGLNNPHISLLPYHKLFWPYLHIHRTHGESFEVEEDTSAPKRTIVQVSNEKYKLNAAMNCLL